MATMFLSPPFLGEYQKELNRIYAEELAHKFIREKSYTPDLLVRERVAAIVRKYLPLAIKFVARLNADGVPHGCRLRRMMLADRDDIEFLRCAENNPHPRIAGLFLVPRRGHR